MKNFTYVSFCLISFLLWSQLNAQQNKPQKEVIRCATDENYERMIAQNPNTITTKEELNSVLSPIIENIKANRLQDPEALGGIITIPVVVHVIHNGDPVNTPGNVQGENISEAQILSQIEVLNEDYRRIMGTPGAGVSGYEAGVDTQIEFCLAQQDPNGNPTNGITRHDLGQDSWNSDTSVDINVKPQTIWDRNRYMNMWTVKFGPGSGGLLGYAQFPGGPADTDGVVSGAQNFGSSDDDDGSFYYAAPFDKGRTMTHEVGHYLGLYHTFQGGCSAPGDGVDDTPFAAAPNFGCPGNASSCGSIDMVENYMDYTDDTCMNTFTQGQSDRMMAAINTYRSSLLSSEGCSASNLSDDAALSIESFNDCLGELNVELSIRNSGNNNLTSAEFSYGIQGQSTQTYSWNGNLATGESDNITLPTTTFTENGTFTATITSANGGTDNFDGNNTVQSDFEVTSITASNNVVEFTLITDNYGDETTWSLKDSNGTVLYSGGPYTQGPSHNINETFNLNNNECYTFELNDSYGDGICCEYGQGSYTLTSNGVELASGGEFEDNETVKFAVGSLSTVEVNASDSFAIFPNPASHTLTIRSKSREVLDSYVIYAANGKLVGKQNVKSSNDLNVNISSLPKGVYFIELQGENTYQRLKFIKK